MRTVLSADRNTCTRAPQLVRAFICWVQSSLSFKYLLCQNCKCNTDELILFIVAVLADKKGEKMYTSARKQMLISSLPPVIILHLKRFHQVRTLYPFFLSLFQIWYCVGLFTLSTPCCSADGCKAGMNFRKVNRHVDFPLILDMAPFCSALCKVLGYMCFIAKYMENTYVWLFLAWA